MKKFFKMGCLGFIGLIVLIIVIAVATSGNEEKTDKSEPASTQATQEKTTDSSNATKATNSDTKTTEATDDGVLTKEKFEQIKDGMTYEEVVKIIGSEGELLSESGEKGTSLYTVMYSFKADGSFGANSSMMFQGGKLMNKSQFGLGGNSDVTITKSEFDKIQNNMSYEEVSKIVGGEGEVASESGEKGTSLHTIMISYTGEGDLGANASLMFQGDKLMNKTQIGLK
ncbi:DUF3862 domain-containing protein [Priestia megaterium]|uniref:DUF3862 domain-containing protein n=1 Tax=Priestia megaterium TaxID=1404 RepID=UPI002730A3AE|nr:DUF3862 domain-containing protein [Priestia megaterium]MDP1383004.1 DUF3862 domain-containing protein [Priestia megaterium]MDP1426950.1 DUF3862 domain-containing protein [Priestia megaterium]